MSKLFSAIVACRSGASQIGQLDTKHAVQLANAVIEQTKDPGTADANKPLLHECALLLWRHYLLSHISNSHTDDASADSSAKSIDDSEAQLLIAQSVFLTFASANECSDSVTLSRVALLYTKLLMASPASSVSIHQNVIDICTLTLYHVIHARCSHSSSSRYGIELQSLHCSLLSRLYASQLSIGVRAHQTSAQAKHAKLTSDLEAKYTLTASYRQPIPVLILPRHASKQHEQATVDEYVRDNVYERVVFLIALIESRFEAMQQALADATAAATVQLVKPTVKQLKMQRDAADAATLQHAQAIEQVNQLVNDLLMAFKACAEHEAQQSPKAELTRHAPLAVDQRLSTKMHSPVCVGRQANSIVFRVTFESSEIKSIKLYAKRYDGQMAQKNASLAAQVTANNTEFEGSGVRVPVIQGQSFVDISINRLPMNTMIVAAYETFNSNGKSINGVSRSSACTLSGAPALRIAHLSACATVLLRRLSHVNASDKRLKLNQPLRQCIDAGVAAFHCFRQSECTHCHCAHSFCIHATRVELAETRR